MPELYLGQWQWVTADNPPSWQMPRADIGLGSLDLRSLPQCGSPGPAQQGYGLFALSQRDDTIGHYLGNNLDGLVRAPLKRTLKVALALGEDIIANTPLAILIELLNRHADPMGQTRWKPLRGSLRQGVKLYLANQQFALPFDTMVRANTIAVFQADYRRNKADGTPLEALRKWTGAIMRNLWGRMGDDLVVQLLPSEYVADGWQVPSTTITESFNTADSDILGPDLAWTEVQGDLDVVSNRAKTIASAFNTAYAPALSSDDHYSQAQLWEGNASGFGPVARLETVSQWDFYGAISESWSTKGFVIGKELNGVYTRLANSAVGWVSPTGETYKIEADGSTLTHYVGGSQKLQTTDTAITGNLNAGLFGYGANHQFDAFEAGDLAAAAINLERLERHYPRGVLRGVLRGTE